MAISNNINKPFYKFSYIYIIAKKLNEWNMVYHISNKALHNYVKPSYKINLTLTGNMDPWYCSMTNSLYRLRKYKTQTGYMSPYYLSKAYITNIM
jgi:hypothetical protein